MNALLEEILDDPEKNEEKYLTKRTEEMGMLSDNVLKEAAFKAHEKKDDLEAGTEEAMKKKYFVQ